MKVSFHAPLLIAASLLGNQFAVVLGELCDAPPELPPHAKALDIATGNWKAQALRSYVSTGLASAMDELCRPGFASASKIAAKAGVHEEATYRLLRFLSTFDVVVEGGDQTFTLGPVGDAVTPSNPNSVGAAVLLEASYPHGQVWSHLDDFVKTNEGVVQKAFGFSYWDMAASNPTHLKIFHEAMTGYSNADAHALSSSEMSPSLDLSSFQTICDLGCAEGRLSFGLAERFPDANYILADLPESIKRFDTSALPPKFSTVSTNFLEEVPPAADAYLLKNILHDWDDESCVVILDNIKKASPNAVVFVIGFGPVPGPNVPHLAKGFDIHMGVMVSGRERTAEQFRGIYDKSGFELKATHLIADGNYHMYIEEIQVFASPNSGM